MQEISALVFRARRFKPRARKTLSAVQETVLHLHDAPLEGDKVPPQDAPARIQATGDAENEPISS